MNFLRAKLFMILCIAVVALGIGIFVMGYLVSSGNQKGMQDIESVVQSTGSLEARLVHENEIREWAAGADAWEQTKEEAKALIRQTSARPVLEPVEVFQEDIGGNYSWYRRFANNYCRFVEDLLIQLDAKDKLSEADEDAIRQARQDSQISGTTTGRDTEQSKIETLIVDERKTRAQSISIYANPAIFCCYNHWLTQPSNTDHSAMLNDIWYTQVAAWIQEDVVSIVKQFNEAYKTGDVSAKSVYNSPVKRIVGVGFNGSAPSSGEGQSSGGTSGALIAGSRSGEGAKSLPQYVVADVPTTTGMSVTGAYAGVGADPPALGADPPALGADPPALGADPPPTGVVAPAVGGYAMPATVPAMAAPAAAPAKGGMIGAAPLHVSDNLTNVVHFSISVMIDSSKIYQFINALQTTKLTSSLLSADSTASYERNQITVLQVDVEPIDIAVENGEGYYYGSASVKRVTLVCEYVFFQMGYEEYMPASIKSIFGAVSPGGN